MKLNTIARSHHLTSSLKYRGFSLIELMIVVAIIAILAMVGFPSYNEYVLRGKRAEGRAALLDAAAVLERHYSQYNAYANIAGEFPIPHFNATTNIPTETRKYTLSIAIIPPFQAYTIIATPTFLDPDCGNLSLTQAGTRDRTGTNATIKDCWGR